MSILITGGAGYIGSHVALELLKLNQQIIIIDNLSHSTGANVKALQGEYPQKVTFYETDILSEQQLQNVFSNHSILGVIHLAGKKSVKESFSRSLDYYHNNVSGTLQLLKVMNQYKCYNLIFSSSATVYGIPKKSPISESAFIQPINPYGHSKAMIDKILSDLGEPWKIISLRYFNPVGLDMSGILKEETEDTPENLFPYIIKVLKGDLEKLTVFGDDYPTRDGSAIRDYIHITDLAIAHIKSWNYLSKLNSGECDFFNIGTGRGNSVLEILKCFQTLGRPVKYTIGPRREGDAAQVYANPKKAKQILGWESTRCLAEMIKDSLLN